MDQVREDAVCCAMLVMSHVDHMMLVMSHVDHMMLVMSHVHHMMLVMSHVDHMMLTRREKRLLIGGDNFGRDLVGVQNLQKKHSRVESELTSHHDELEVRESLILLKTTSPFPLIPPSFQSISLYTIIKLIFSQSDFSPNFHTAVCAVSRCGYQWDLIVRSQYRIGPLLPDERPLGGAHCCSSSQVSHPQGTSPQ